MSDDLDRDEVDEVDVLVHRADLDGLVRLIDSMSAGRDWAGLLRVRDRARHAVLTGRQLWPAATLAEYRLALWAPAEWAAQVLDEDSGRFTIGPLTEVVAQQHTLAELRSFLPGGPRLGFVAHERAMRGEAVDADGLVDVLDLPFALQPWEPRYALATYGDDGVDAPAPPRPPAERFRVIDGTVRTRIGDGDGDGDGDGHRDEVTSAVRQLLEPWTASSNGRVEVVCVEGGVADALATLGIVHARVAPLAAGDALAWLAWAGSSGGAHGRRRGGAIGRFGAWWVLAALGDVCDEWPVDPDDLGELAGELGWWWWDAGEPALGWELQLAIDDPVEGLAWAISAHDAH
ncbi:MAG: hypothetical protein KDB40_15710 [Acidimicrobiales bacterium]|nr:hypothetical protein [Acidimicrobiales bacterium]MCB9393014.1 hypothetical protein [Acidimicrobiaceae bacterium]